MLATLTVLSLAGGWFVLQPSQHLSIYKVMFSKTDYSYSAGHVSHVIRCYAAAVLRACTCVQPVCKWIPSSLNMYAVPLQEWVVTR